ncbi:MAG: GTPase HflX, partial [Rhodospirillales bacterium]
PDSAAQEADVVAVLQELGLDQDRFEAMIEVLNKIDLMTEAERDIQANRARRGDRLVILASAVTGEGLAGLLSALEERLGADWTWVEARLGHGAGAAIAWLYQHGEVHDRQDDADGCRLRVRLSPADLERFRRLNPTVTVKPIDG